jgi:hypothetical protein
MALVYVGGKTAGEASASTSYIVSLTDLTGGIASAPTVGDLVVIASGWGGISGGNPGATTGYTEVADLFADDTRDTNFDVSYKFMGATPDTQVTIAKSNNSNWGSGCAIHVWRNVDPTTPLDVTSTTATGTNGNQADGPAITPTTSGAVVLSLMMSIGGSTHTALTAPATLTNVVSAAVSGPTQNCAVGIGSHAWTSGAFDPAAWTGGVTSTSDSWAAVTLALRPDPAAVDTSAWPVVFVCT